jgi:Rap1a immunity proteins
MARLATRAHCVTPLANDRICRAIVRLEDIDLSLAENATEDFGMRLRVLLLAGGLSWPTHAFSQAAPGHFISGNKLYKDCNAPPESPKNGICIGYVEGITDALNMNGTVCTPADVTVRQAERVIVKYIREDNPEYRHFAASLLAGAALGQAFPCK